MILKSIYLEHIHFSQYFIIIILKILLHRFVEDHSECSYMAIQRARRHLGCEQKWLLVYFIPLTSAI